MSVTKKQTSLAIIAVVFATAMIAGTLVASDNLAFAHHGKKVKQGIAQENANNQAVSCNTQGGPAFATSGGGLLGAGATAAGGIGGLITLGSCSNTNTNLNPNTGNNVFTP